MKSLVSPRGLARICARHPWLTLVAWVLVVVGGALASSQMTFSAESEIEGAEYYRANQLLEERFGHGEIPEETIVVRSDRYTVDDGEYRDFVNALTADLRGTEGVASIFNVFEVGPIGEASMISADRTMTLILAEVEGEADDAETTVEPLLKRVNAEHPEGFEVLTVGHGSINKELNAAFAKDLANAEKLGIPAALVVLFLVFGAVVAAGVPLILGFLAIAIAVGVTALISLSVGISSVTMNMITMVGLAVGIDYSLFIVERYREERARGTDKIAAIETAGDTASRAVLFSGITVVIALTSLLIVPVTDFKGMAIGAIVVVFAAVSLALTLLPALLSLLDTKLNWLHLPGRTGARRDDGRSFFDRTTRVVVRHPILSAGLASGLLLVMASPLVTINLGSPGLAEFPDHLQSVQAYNVLNEHFSAGRLDPTEVVIDGDMQSPDVQAGIEKLRTMVAADERFGFVEELEVNEAGDTGLLNILVNGDPDSLEARAAVEELRATYIPEAFAGTGAKALVTGTTAGTIDYIDAMVSYLPIVITFVLALSFVLLTMVFRSIVIPIKAILMNLLSVGASYGMIVAVFQHGFLADLFRFQQTESIVAFLPPFLFAILFGLSMDYHVFLLSRIQERFLQTRDNTGSVAYGLRSTAHIITGAAAIMVVVFAGFASGDLVILQQLGFGLAVAIFLDATIVRSVLVPASMELLGEANWYLPSWLRWLPRISVEGSSQPDATPTPVAGSALARQAAGGK